MQSSSRSRWLVLIGLAFVAILAALGIVLSPTAPVPAPQEATVEADEEVPQVATAPVVEPVAPAVPEPANAAAPQFDTFRVEPDSTMVVAGRAEPGQIVQIILSGDVLDTVTADGQGNFVAFPVAGFDDAPRKLSLLADPDGTAVPSETSFIIAPIRAPEAVVAEAAPETAATQLAEAPQDDPAVEIVTTPAPEALAVSEATAPAAPAAPVVLQTAEDGIRVVQSATVEPAETAQPNVALDAITYDPSGEVRLSGRATGDGAVQVYLDNEPISVSPVTQGGDWRIDLPDVETGVYTLRIDEVDSAGEVVSRLETPFKREEASDVAAVLAEQTASEGFEVAVRTVQPGSTLWAIAEENLGKGIYYIEVFEANRDLIRDPDLIYPGQIFRIPGVPQ